MLKKIFVLLFMLSASSLSGEIRTLTLSNALDIALLNNLQLAQMAQDIKIAEAQYNESFADFALPGINLGAGVNVNDPTTVDNSKIISPNYTNMNIPYPVTGGGGGTVTIPTLVPTGAITNQTIYFDNYSLTLGITKPIFAGGKLWNALNIKKINLDLAKMKMEDQKRQTIQDVSTAFYNLFLLKENIKVTSDLDKSLKERLDYARANYRAGRVAEYDLISADVRYKNNQPVLLQLKNAYESAKISFINLLNLSNDTEVEFIGNLSEATNLILTNLDPAVIIPLALSNSISLKSLDFSLAVLKLSRDISEGGKLPVVSWFFNYNFNYKKNKSSDTDRSFVPSWNTGLQFSMPLDALIPISKTSQTTAEVEDNIKKTELTKEQLSDLTILQVKTLLMQIEQSRQTIESQSQNVNQAKLGYKLATDRYRAGTSSSLELTDAEVSLSQALVGYLQTVYNYYSGVTQLKRMVGW